MRMESTCGRGGFTAVLKKWETFRRSRNSETPVIRYDQYRLSAGQWIFAIGKGEIVCGILTFTFYRSFLVFLVMSPIAWFYPIYEKRRLKHQRLLILGSQFKESMVVLAGALSAGYSVENALVASRGELVLLYGEDSLIVKEYSYMIQQMRMNRSVEWLFQEFAERSGLEDIQSFAEVLTAAKRSGGDLSGIMRHTAEVIRDKMQVKEEIRTMTAARQFEQKIMNLIPFFIVFYVDISSPGFFRQMYETWMGRCLMSLCLVLYLISFFLSRKILNIEV
ncbi:MAG: type II secretion system F family protein [Brotaphodocola sp.]